jgi:Zn-dependent M28 family amino/carboxypeptidase
MRTLVAAAVALLLAASGASAAAPSRARISAALRAEVNVPGMRAHLVALERIADRNGGTRGTGTPGYEASASYVREQLARVGYRARLVPFPFTSYREELERGRQLTPVERELRPEALDYSPSTPPGGLIGTVVAAGDGCQTADFTGVRGKIALVRRGTCFFSAKAQNAEGAGAAAVIVYNNEPGTVDATLGSPNATRIPAVTITAALGEALASARDATVRIEVRTRTRRTTSRNVVAERTGSGRVLVVGAHLDSVGSGPGINDNATGVAALVELAKALGRHAPQLRVRLTFWGAEELGLHGSRAYVRQLPPAERARIVGYLNFDMLGSRRFVRGVYAGPFARTFRRYFGARGLAARTIDVEGRSDHAPFARAGIPVGGLYAGGDDCYHRPCDRVASVNLRGLGELADAAAHAVAALAPRRSG